MLANVEMVSTRAKRGPYVCPKLCIPSSTFQYCSKWERRKRRMRRGDGEKGGGGLQQKHHIIKTSVNAPLQKERNSQ